MLQHLTDTSVSVLPPTECWSFLCLNYLTFGTVSCSATGGHGELGTQPRRAGSGWWQKPREDAAEKRLPAIMPGMTEAAVEGAPRSPRRSEKKEEELALGRNPLRRIWWDWNIHMPSWKRRYWVCQHSQSLVLSALAMPCTVWFLSFCMQIKTLEGMLMAVKGR